MIGMAWQAAGKAPLIVIHVLCFLSGHAYWIVAPALAPGRSGWVRGCMKKDFFTLIPFPFVSSYAEAYRATVPLELFRWIGGLWILLCAG